MYRYPTHLVTTVKMRFEKVRYRHTHTHTLHDQTDLEELFEAFLASSKLATITSQLCLPVERGGGAEAEPAVR